MLGFDAMGRLALGQISQPGPGSWSVITDPAEAWTVQTKQTEVWTEQPKQSETWTVQPDY